MNGIKITFSGPETGTYQLFSPVVPPLGSEIYIRGYYYSVIKIEYYITDLPGRDNYILEASVDVINLR